LRDNPDPTEKEVRIALSGNLCRCTGYQNIVTATLAAAQKLKDSPEPKWPRGATLQGAAPSP